MSNEVTFRPSSVSAQQVTNMECLQEACIALADKIDALVPNGRYKAIAKTKLEEVCMFANKGISKE